MFYCFYVRGSIYYYFYFCFSVLPQFWNLLQAVLVCFISISPCLFLFYFVLFCTSKCISILPQSWHLHKQFLLILYFFVWPSIRDVMIEKIIDQLIELRPLIMKNLVSIYKCYSNFHKKLATRSNV